MYDSLYKKNKQKFYVSFNESQKKTDFGTKIRMLEENIAARSGKDPGKS